MEKRPRAEGEQAGAMTKAHSTPKAMGGSSLHVAGAAGQ
jgi:hypothetical protein